MKHPLIWFMGLFGLLVVFLIVRSTDWYKETIDPKAYWTERVTRRTELLNTYIADARKCADELERLNRPESRDLWVKQKGLEGMSATEALADYRSYNENAAFACRFAREMIPGATQDLEQARAALHRAMSR